MGKSEVPFFLEVWPFLRNYWRSEVRFSKEPPHKFAYMEPDGPLKTYLTAVFGVFADNDEGKKTLIPNTLVQSSSPTTNSFVKRRNRN